MLGLLVHLIMSFEPYMALFHDYLHCHRLPKLPVIGWIHFIALFHDCLRPSCQELILVSFWRHLINDVATTFVQHEPNQVFIEHEDLFQW